MLSDSRICKWTHKLFEYAENDGIPKKICHNDINSNNILMNDDVLEIIDRELEGYNDPASSSDVLLIYSIKLILKLTGC